MGKVKPTGDQFQKETFDTSLDPIHPDGKAVEERKYLNTSEEQESIGKEKNTSGSGSKGNL